MPLSLRWISLDHDDDRERLARTRMLCYSAASNELDTIRDRLTVEPRNRAADFLLAEQDGVPVGTATGLHLTLWARGGSVPCQGVAWVGTIRTHRRGGSGGGTAGVATHVMREALRMARERGQVVSALMPFRASFYEHLGYGLVERRADWTVPLAVMPPGRFDGVRIYENSDLAALVECRQRIARRGQCDMERPAAYWELCLKRAADGFFVVDRPEPDGPVRGWAYFQQSPANGKTLLRVVEIGYETPADLMRLLHFFGSLKDQYSAAVLTLPVDLPLNLLLRETQLPHRPVEHPAAEMRAYTRMQLRVLDHKRFIEVMHVPSTAREGVTVAIRETEGQISRLGIEFADGRAQVGAVTGEAQFECTDVTWASVVCGDLRATAAVELGLATCHDPAAARLLDAFADGPAPFCGEYF
jgi:predicted acetyltransferase